MKNFLTPDERQKLKATHKKSLSVKEIDRIKAVLLRDAGWSYVAIAGVLLVDEDTVSRHVKEYRVSKKLTLASGGSESKLNAEQTTILIEHLEEVIYPNVKPIVAYIKEKFGITYTTHGMVSWLKAHDFAYKKPSTVPAKLNPAEQEPFIAIRK